jgi:F-type H+-transporting ATPase subunit gamma
MEQLENIKRKIDSAGDLQSVVKTMKALSAVNIRHYQKSAEALKDYTRTLEMGLQIAVKYGPLDIINPPAVPETLGAVIFGSEHGMCGQFNKNITNFAAEKIDSMGIEREKRKILTLGEQILPTLEGLGIVPDRKLPMSSSFSRITAILDKIVLQIDKWYFQEKLDQILLFYNEPARGTSYSPHSHCLIPLDLAWLEELKKKPWPSKRIPTYMLDWEELFFSLLDQYFFMVLYRAFVYSLTSENSSRLSAMQAAEDNIEERLKNLRTSYQHQRKASITDELMDISAGFEVLKEKE